jgi:hypothetical protein
LGLVFRVGVSFFWPVLAIGLLMFVVVAAFIIVLVLFGVVAFLIHWGVGVLALLILIPTAIIGIFVAAITTAMGERFIVIERKGVFDSIGDGFNLWRSNLGSSIIYSLLYVAIAIGLVIAVFVLMMFILMPFIAIGFMNLLLALITGIPLVLLVLIVVEGFTNSAMHLMTTEFYYQLMGQSQDVPVQSPDFPDQPKPTDLPPPQPDNG